MTFIPRDMALPGSLPQQYRANHSIHWSQLVVQASQMKGQMRRQQQRQQNRTMIRKEKTKMKRSRTVFQFRAIFWNRVSSLSSTWNRVSEWVGFHAAVVRLYMTSVGRKPEVMQATDVYQWKTKKREVKCWQTTDHNQRTIRDRTHDHGMLVQLRGATLHGELPFLRLLGHPCPTWVFERRVLTRTTMELRSLSATKPWVFTVNKYWKHP